MKNLGSYVRLNEYTTISVRELEKHLFIMDDWDGLFECPRKLILDAKSETAEGIPTAIGYVESIGYYLMQCGQEPYIAMIESDYE